MVQTRQHQYVVSLNKTLYLHCFSRLSCQMSTRLGHPRQGWLFSAMSFSEEIALRHQRFEKNPAIIAFFGKKLWFYFMCKYFYLSS